MVMEDLYYSKKLDRYFPTRLDCLLYAHDGRGLGHVSRTVAIGIALKRLDPDLKVLVISGSAQTGMLIGPAPLDWIKLPSYQTVLKDGVPTGGTGGSGYYKSVLGKLRGHMLESMVSVLRPRCALVDHNPTGKRKELLAAIGKSREHDTRWVLGIRGVVGEDPGLWSEETARAAELYHSVLWYGDSRVLGTDPVATLAGHFGRDICEMGYVSRLRELEPLITGDNRGAEESIGCTISIPWLGESGEELLTGLGQAVGTLDAAGRACHLYVPAAEESRVKQLFASLPHCSVRQISDRYLASLLHSDSALIYGGYNSLLDVAAAGVPAVVILRSTRDDEQPEHLKKFQSAMGGAGGSLQVIESEQLDGDRLQSGLQTVLGARPVRPADLNLDGAEKTALYLKDLITQNN